MFVHLLSLHDVDADRDDAKQQELMASFEAMVCFYLSIQDELQETRLADYSKQGDEVRWTYILPHIYADLAQIAVRISLACGGDTHGIKHHTAEYASLDPSDLEHIVVLGSGTSKADWGFNHPKLGHLLVLVDYLEEFNWNMAGYIIHALHRSSTQPLLVSIEKSRLVPTILVTN